MSVMSKKKTDQEYTLKPLTEQATEGIWGDFMIGVLSKTKDSMALLEIYSMIRDGYQATRETTKQQLKLKYCLYTVLLSFIVISATLVSVFYYVGMTTIGLSFLGPLITGIIGLAVVLVTGRRE